MPRPSVREVIVDSAVTEFHRNGFAACSVDTITRAAGVPKGSFYNHFKSKEDLGAEVVARYAASSGWRDSHGELGPLDTLRARFTVMRDVLEDNEYTRGCLIGNMGAERADHSPVIREQVGESLTHWSDSIAESIREAQAAGEVPADRDADLLGRFVLDAWEGAIIRTKVAKSAAPLDDFFAVVFGSLL
ncbi:TetR/AcrR family transcriptional regulator [Amycolatopsis sp. FDAARGOS 1241]|uniref:TetR/AcrR family transcriptional regulator n=1 Tax=Amycolatopsis sp. FDAARGOS 1241 TaxID=2778070 RepID=UPI0019507E91|nr:TetR/AcrR family transcriptional regulator [Amycolatopsis sp. FDAARGOS 1241]QRP47647.1 TetR family transcriptional regulator C-terminal domain-containing protein [Amycolatopsis sp. FDAARGOS 1241]